MQTESNDIKTVSAPRVALLTVADLCVLVRAMPDWSGLIAHLSEPQHWVQQAGTDRVVTTLALALLWLAACWLAVGLAAAVASQLPGQLGRMASLATGRLLPRTLQRLVVTAASASIAFTPVAAMAATPTPAATPSASIVLVLPTDGAPVQTAPETPPQATAPQATAPQATAPQATAPKTTAPDRTERETTAGKVRVRPGDSLWTITARQLGTHATPAQVAAAWPRLYAANRSVIGGDPNLLRTGENLTVPASIEGQ